MYYIEESVVETAAPRVINISLNNSKDLPSGKFLDDSIVIAILERKFLLSLRIIKFSQ
jgi:hypothetical protein